MGNQVDTVIDLQPEVVRILKQSIIKERLSHAYLFEGDRGTGKKEMAILLAKFLLCPDSKIFNKIVDGCHTCNNCLRIDQMNHPDLTIIEPDGLSIKKEQIQFLQEDFQKKSMESDRKVYVLIDAEKMTNSAANSLLKYLEEPYEGTIILLLTTAIQKILPTILSRCQVIHFKQLDIQSLYHKLVLADVPKTKAYLIANVTSNIEEALILHEDDWFLSAQKLVEKLFSQITNVVPAMLFVQEEWLSHFKERNQFDLGLLLLLFLYRDLLWIKLGKENDVLNVEAISKWKNTIHQLSVEQITDKITVILDARRKLTANMNQQLLMEQLILNLREGFIFV